MDITIGCNERKDKLVYTQADLRKLARQAAKWKGGKLDEFWVNFQEGQHYAMLVVQYKLDNGWTSTTNVAL